MIKIALLALFYAVFVGLASAQDNDSVRAPDAGRSERMSSSANIG